MTKDEMMLLTVKQLSNYFALHPECFGLEEQDLPNLSHSFHNSTIIFQSSNDIMSNPRTVALIYNNASETLTCNIYFKTLLLGQQLSALKPDATSQIAVNWKWFNKSYKKFRQLRSKLVTRKKNMESDEFLKKLHSVFPGTFDDYIFGKRE